MSAPYEVLAAAGMTCWLATANTAKPNVDATPSGSWFKLGTNGADNYDESGVQVKHEQSLKTFTPLGSTAPIKAWRESEGLNVSLTVVDLTAEHYAKTQNSAAITTIAASSGVPGSKKFSLYQGHEVTLYALLVRGNVSPYGDGWNFQYWLPVVCQAEGVEPVFKKADPAGLKLSYMALKDSTNGFGVFEPQTATAV